MARIRVSLLASAVLGAAPLLAQKPTVQPAPASADADRPGTHKVKRGDTLWGIAKTYLGDAYLWPEIYRLNTSVVEDPHWIYPGESLRLPGGAKADVADAPSAAPSGPSNNNAYTVFNPKHYQKGQRSARDNMNLLAATTAVRAGEYEASPFAVTVPGPNGGVLKSSGEAQQVDQTPEARSYYQLREPVFMTLPAGASRAAGTKYMTYVLSTPNPAGWVVAIPTGILKVAGDKGTGNVRAEVVTAFQPLEPGQGVIALDGYKARPGVFPTAVEFGRAVKVTWMKDNPVLMQQRGYLMLDVTAKDGVQPGDQATFYAPLGADENGVPRPDEVVAVVQILRVTDRGAAAIVLRRGAGPFDVGATGRITAKMP